MKNFLIILLFPFCALPVAAQTVAADSTAATDGTAIPDTLIAKADTLKKFKPTANVVTPSDDTME